VNKRKKSILLFLITALIICLFVIFLSSTFFMEKAEKFQEGTRKIVKIVKKFSFADSRSLVDWEEKVLTSRKTEYRLGKEDGKSCVTATSKDSASSLYYKQELSHDKNPYISWEWIVKKFPERKGKETLNKKKEFDFAAQVYVIFYSRFFLNTKAIQYVWTETIPVGVVANNPYTKNVKLMVLETGPSETWKSEERDITEDFRLLFGEDLSKDVRAIAFMTDADSTGSEAEACFANVTLGYITKNGEECMDEKIKSPWEKVKDYFLPFSTYNERSSH